MAVPTVMSDLSITAASNSPAGSESPTSGDDFLRALGSILRTTNAKGSDIASATTTDIGAATAEFVDVTGTTTITGLGTIAAGIRRTVRFTGALTLTHNSTSLILPGAANITTANGDVAEFRSLGSGNWVCSNYMRKDGNSVTGVTSAQLQNQTYISFTTGGTSTAYTLTPTPALASLTTGHRFNVTFNATAGATPTLAISGLTAKSLKVYDISGAKVAASSSTIVANLNSDVIYDGTDYVVIDPVVANVTNSKIQPITAAVAASALTLTLNPTSLDFRSTTLGSGTVTTVSNVAAISTVISSTSTAGTVNNIQNTITVLAINNAGTMELAWVNNTGGVKLDESSLITTIAEGGAGAADSANVIYSTTARTGVAFRIVGYVTSTQATAGTWATAPSLIQGAGGQSVNLTSIGFGSYFQSANQTITSAGGLTIPHGLGRAPVMVQCYLYFVNSVLGYTAGDISPVHPSASDSGSARGLSIVTDATNIVVKMGSAANVFFVINKTTGAVTSLTNTDAQLIFRVWG